MIIIKVPARIKLITGHDYGVESGEGVLLATFRHQDDANACLKLMESLRVNDPKLVERDTDAKGDDATRTGPSPDYIPES
jgi:hypothetical protein